MDLSRSAQPALSKLDGIGKEPYDALVTPDGRYYIAGLFGEDGLALVDLWHPEPGARRILAGYGRGEEPLPVYKMPHLRGWAVAGPLRLPAGDRPPRGAGRRQRDLAARSARIAVAGQPVFVMAQPDGRAGLGQLRRSRQRQRAGHRQPTRRRSCTTLEPGKAVLHLEFTPRGEEVWISSRDDDRVVGVRHARASRRSRTLAVDEPSGIFFTSRAARIGVLDDAPTPRFRPAQRLAARLPARRRGPFAAIARRRTAPAPGRCSTRFAALHARRRDRAASARVFGRGTVGASTLARDGGAARSGSKRSRGVVSGAPRRQPQLRARAPLQPLVRRHRPRRGRGRRDRSTRIEHADRLPGAAAAACRATTTSTSASICAARVAACGRVATAAAIAGRAPPTSRWPRCSRPACRWSSRPYRAWAEALRPCRTSRCIGDARGAGSREGTLRRFGASCATTRLGYRGQRHGGVGRAGRRGRCAAAGALARAARRDARATGARAPPAGPTTCTAWCTAATAPTSTRRSARPSSAAACSGVAARGAVQHAPLQAVRRALFRAPPCIGGASHEPA